MPGRGELGCQKPLTRLEHHGSRHVTLLKQGVDETPARVPSASSWNGMC